MMKKQTNLEEMSVTSVSRMWLLGTAFRVLMLPLLLFVHQAAKGVRRKGEVWKAVVAAVTRTVNMLADQHESSIFTVSC